jgi:pimeloyl-ACP methyl ester carboxylesterase
MPVVAVNHEEIYYARHGASGVPLVCLHGAGGSHAGWFNAVKLLENVSAFALDLPAHGFSTGQGRDNVAAYAEVVAGFLDALSLPLAVIAGHSLGGAIALWLALHQPARVRGLVLAGTGAKLRVHPDILQAAKEGRPVASAAVVGGQPYAEGVRPPARAAGSIGQSAATSRPEAGDRAPTAAPEVVYNDWVACDTFNVMDRLGEIRVPTLVIVGANDVMTPPKYAGFLAKGIAGAALVTIDDAGHSPMIDKPFEVAAAIQPFLNSLPR